MNRRKFLAGCASAALLPTIGPKSLPVYGRSQAMDAMEGYQRLMDGMIELVRRSPEFMQAEMDFLTYGQCTFSPLKALAEAGLDRPTGPCDDSKAGGDQIT